MQADLGEFQRAWSTQGILGHPELHSKTVLKQNKGNFYNEFYISPNISSLFIRTENIQTGILKFCVFTLRQCKDDSYKV